MAVGRPPTSAYAPRPFPTRHGVSAIGDALQRSWRPALETEVRSDGMTRLTGVRGRGAGSEIHDHRPADDDTLRPLRLTDIRFSVRHLADPVCQLDGIAEHQR